MKTSTNYYDAHKRFSQVHVLGDDGSTAWKGRIDDNDPAAFESLVHQLGGSCKAVFEASMNWHVLHDTLSSIKAIEEVVMAHPLKVRIICDAQLKNDKVDAMRLAQLLRLDMVPRAHAASPEARHTKELVRQRACWVCKQLETRCRDNPDMKLLRTIPGLGKVLASVIGSEIDGIGRFATKAHFIGYCGLAPTTHGSAGKFNQGRMIARCNRWLKWAFIEAAWVAIGCDAYLGSLFKAQRDRGKKANTAIAIVARRIAQIAWEILNQQRSYRNDIKSKPVTGTKTFPARSSQGLVGEPA